MIDESRKTFFGCQPPGLRGLGCHLERSQILGSAHISLSAWY